jgi:hypothetical protein
MEVMSLYNDIVGEDGVMHWSMPHGDWPVKDASALRMIRSEYATWREKDRKAAERKSKSKRGGRRGK